MLKASVSEIAILSKAAGDDVILANSLEDDLPYGTNNNLPVPPKTGKGKYS
jgi:hypothetical protein